MTAPNLQGSRCLPSNLVGLWAVSHRNGRESFGSDGTTGPGRAGLHCVPSRPFAWTVASYRLAGCWLLTVAESPVEMPEQPPIPSIPPIHQISLRPGSRMDQGFQCRSRDARFCILTGSFSHVVREDPDSSRWRRLHGPILPLHVLFAHRLWRVE